MGSFLGTGEGCGLSTGTRGENGSRGPRGGQQRARLACLPSDRPQQRAGFAGIADGLHRFPGGDDSELTRDVAFAVGEGDAGG